MRVAVIGTGIAGNAAAWTCRRLSGSPSTTATPPGGHSHTVTIDYDGTGLRSISLHRLNDDYRPDRHCSSMLSVETVDS